MLFKRFRKPRWQNKDAEIRARAVAGDQDPDLLSSLADIASNDPDASVRLAALKRLDDPRLWSQAVTEDPSASVRQQAIARIQLLLRQTSDETLAGSLLKTHAQAQWITELTTASLHSVRLAAARKGNKASHWLAVVEKASEAQLHQLMDELNDSQLLRDLLKRLPGKHKTAIAMLEARLDRQLLAAGDPATVEKHALRLCEQYTALCQETEPETLKQELASLDKAWAVLPTQALNETLINRRNGARNTVLNILVAHDPAHQEKQRQEARDEAQRLQSMLRELAGNAGTDLHTLRIQLDKLEKQWKALPQHLLEPEQKARWQDALDLLEQQLMKQLEAADIPAELQALFNRIQKLAHSPVDELNSRHLTRLEEDLTRFTAQHTHLGEGSRQLLQKIKDSLHRQVSRLENRLQELDQSLRDFQHKLVDMQQALEEGQVKKAASLEQKLRKLASPLRKHQRLKANEEKTLDRLHHQLREQRQWLHWANEDHRKSLCEELERFAETGPHPDAVREKLKQAREQWQMWEKSEHPLPGKQRFAASPSSWRRYSRIRKQLETRTQPYFEKRQALQKERWQQCLQALEEAKKLFGSESPWSPEQARQVEKQRRQLIHWLQRLDELPPDKRKHAAHALRQQLDQSKKQLNQCHAQWEKQRQSLIDQAAEAAQLDDLQQAMDQAIQLQKRWKHLPHLPRYREQKLWQTFRQHCDAIFQRRDDQHAAQQAEQQQLKAQAEQIIQRLQAVDISRIETREALAEAERAVSTLRQDWKALQCTQADLQQRFDNALQTNLAALSKTSEKLERQRFAEQLHALQERKSQHPEEHWPQSWKEAWHMGADCPLDEQGEAELRHQCLQLEILAGQASPPAEAEARMRAQVELVQQKHDGLLPENTTELQQWLLLRWLRHGGGRLGEGHGLKGRFFQAFRQWLQQETPEA